MAARVYNINDLDSFAAREITDYRALPMRQRRKVTNEVAKLTREAIKKGLTEPKDIEKYVNTELTKPQYSSIIGTIVAAIVAQLVTKLVMKLVEKWLDK